MMPTAEGRASTGRASRYLVQLCRHVDQMKRHRLGGGQAPDVEWSDTEGSISAGAGTCTLTATDEALIVRVEAADEAELRRLQEMVAARIESIGRRDGLAVAWERPAGAPHRRARLATIALVVAGFVAVGVHAGVAGAVLSMPLAVAAAAAVALVVVKLAVLAVVKLR